MEEFFIFTRDKDLCDEEGGSFTKVVPSLRWERRDAGEPALGLPRTENTDTRQ